MVSVRETERKTLDLNAAIWGIFMSVTLQAAGHVGTDYTEIFRSARNQSKKSFRQLFQVTRKLITDRTEITGLTTIDWQQLMLRERETTLLTDKAVHFATAETCVFSDSVLCLGGISPEPVGAWESKIRWFMESRYFSGTRVENFTRIHYIGNSRRDSNDDD